MNETTLRRQTAPLVSIVIPAYNCATFIGDTLDSCLTQRYANLEIIVVNDGSSDETASVLAKYGQRIRVLHKTNGGLASARNAGHDIAQGEYIAWLDADDIAHPDRIALEAALLDSEPDVVAVCSDFSAFLTGNPDFEPSHIGTYYSSFQERGGASALFKRSGAIEIGEATVTSRCTYWVGNQFPNLIWGNFVHPPTLMARKRCLDAVGPQDTHLRSGSDYEHILRLSREGPLAFIDASLLRYRRSDQQMSESFVRGETWREYRSILARFKAIDPDVFEQNRRTYNRTVATTYIFEAQSIGNKDRLRAIHLLTSSLAFAFLPMAMARSFPHIATPDFVVDLVRRYRRWKRSRRHSSLVRS